jgi:transposase
MNMKHLFVGIDISKDKFDAAICDWKGRSVFGPKEYAQDQTGMEQLKTDIEIYSKEMRTDILLGCESTGIYHLPLVEFCDRNGLKIRVFNAIELKKYHKSRVRKTRNDSIDAMTIAKAMVIEGDFPDEFKISPEVKTLRQLTRVRTRIADQISTIKRRIDKDLDIICRGYTKLFSNIMYPSSIAVMKKCIQLTRPFDRSENELSEILKVARHPDPAGKAKEIRAVFDKAVIPDGYLESCVLEIKFLIQQYELLSEQKEALEERIVRLVSNFNTQIMTINGIGETNAGIILGEIGSIEKFDDVDELVAFSGLDPSVHDSGNFHSVSKHISKRGSPYLRTAMYLSAVSAIRCNPVCKAFAERLKNKGKKNKVIIVAVARKLLTIVYSVLKNNKPFFVPKSIVITET